MKKLILTLLLFLPLLSIAQNIRGTVVSEKTSLPLDDVNIAALNFNATAFTNENGEFSLKFLRILKKKIVLNFLILGLQP